MNGNTKRPCSFRGHVKNEKLMTDRQTKHHDINSLDILSGELNR